MIPRVHKGGRMAGGLIRYLRRHGRGNKPDEILIENLPDPGPGASVADRLRLAGRIMQVTIQDADLLKRLSGASTRGRRLGNAIHHYTLAWAPGENPTDAEMLEAVEETQNRLGLHDCQYVAVIHRDRDHAHVHVLTNRVREDGRAASVSNDAHILKGWAREYERDHGGIIVHSRLNGEETTSHEPKRVRRDGQSVSQTPFERRAWRDLHRIHRELATPAAIRRQERTALGRLLATARPGLEIPATGAVISPPAADDVRAAGAQLPRFRIKDIVSELNRRTQPAPMPEAATLVAGQHPLRLPVFRLEDLLAEKAERDRRGGVGEAVAGARVEAILPATAITDESRDGAIDQATPGAAAGEHAAWGVAPPSSQSLPGSSVSQRRGEGRGQEGGPDRAEQGSATDRGSGRPSGSTPTSEAGGVGVTEADRLRLAVHAVVATLPRTEPYPHNASYRPPALSNERLEGMAGATDDEFVRAVIAGVQERQRYYANFQLAESEKVHLRPAVARQHAANLAKYEKARKRWFLSAQPAEPTWAEAEAVAIREFEAAQLGVIEDVCREVRQRSPGSVRLELQRFGASAPQDSTHGRGEGSVERRGRVDEKPRGRGGGQRRPGPDYGGR